MNIKGCRAIVTGGTSGIGRATVKALLDAGALHVGAFSRNGGYDLRAEIADARLLTTDTDVRNAIAVEVAIGRLVNAADGLDVLVNCAGVLRDGAMWTPKSKYSLDDWNDVIDTNLRGTFLCSQLAAEVMFRRRIRGVIVNLSSVSRRGRAGQIAYAASKGGIASMTAAMAQELAAMKIRCCGVAPGLIDTPMGRQVPEQHRKEIMRQTPTRRMGTAEEVADAILFCIRNDFVNGTTLEIDGGFLG